MTTLDEYLKKLPAEIREQIEQRANELILEEEALREVEKAIQSIFSSEHSAVGTVVGVTSALGRSIYTCGAVSEDSVFEIGSITKVFTTLLLADLAQKSELSLHDPIDALLPKSVAPPTHEDGSALTLLELATHRSGLPRMPDNLKADDPRNPYANYGSSRLYKLISGLKVRNAGTYEYSNLGVGLLGHLLSRRVLDTTYDSAVRKRILKPLHLYSTGSKVDGLVQGYALDGTPTCAWDCPALAGAGALRSSVNDLLQFVEAHLGLIDEMPLQRAVELALSTRYSIPNGQVALGWHISQKAGTDIVWHNGGTYGFSSLCAFSISKRLGIVVLRNTNSELATTGGLQILAQLLEITSA